MLSQPVRGIAAPLNTKQPTFPGKAAFDGADEPTLYLGERPRLGGRHGRDDESKLTTHLFSLYRVHTVTSAPLRLARLQTVAGGVFVAYALNVFSWATRRSTTDEACSVG